MPERIQISSPLRASKLLAGPSCHQLHAGLIVPGRHPWQTHSLADLHPPHLQQYISHLILSPNDSGGQHHNRPRMMSATLPTGLTSYQTPGEENRTSYSPWLMSDEPSTSLDVRWLAKERSLLRMIGISTGCSRMCIFMRDVSKDVGMIVRTSLW